MSAPKKPPAKAPATLKAPPPPKLSKADRDLIEAACDAIRKRYRYDWQEVGAAIRLRSGKVFTGVSLDAYLGRMAICAEAVALGDPNADPNADARADSEREGHAAGH